MFRRIESHENIHSQGLTFNIVQAEDNTVIQK